MEVAVKQGYTMGLAEGFKLGQLKGTVMAALAQHAVQTINAGGGVQQPPKATTPRLPRCKHW